MQGPGPILEDNGIELNDPVSGEAFTPTADSPVLESGDGFLVFSGPETLAAYQAG